MDVRHQLPEVVPLVDDLWEDYWAVLRVRMQFNGRDAAQWKPVFRGDFYLVTLRSLATVLAMAQDCRHRKDSFEAFCASMRLLQSDVESAQRDWNEECLHKRMKALQGAPWPYRAIQKLFRKRA